MIKDLQNDLNNNKNNKKKIFQQKMFNQTQNYVFKPPSSIIMLSRVVTGSKGKIN